MREGVPSGKSGTVPASISDSAHDQSDFPPAIRHSHTIPQAFKSTSSCYYLCSQSSFQPKLAETEEEEEAEGDGARAMFLLLLLPLLPLLPLLLLLAVLSLLVLLLALVVPPSVGSGEGDGDEDMDHKEEGRCVCSLVTPSPGLPRSPALCLHQVNEM